MVGVHKRLEEQEERRELFILFGFMIIAAIVSLVIIHYERNQLGFAEFPGAITGTLEEGETLRSGTLTVTALRITSQSAIIMVGDEEPIIVGTGEMDLPYGKLQTEIQSSECVTCSPVLKISFESSAITPPERLPAWVELAGGLVGTKPLIIELGGHEHTVALLEKSTEMTIITFDGKEGPAVFPDQTSSAKEGFIIEGRRYLRVESVTTDISSDDIKKDKELVVVFWIHPQWYAETCAEGVTGEIAALPQGKGCCDGSAIDLPKCTETDRTPIDCGSWQLYCDGHTLISAAKRDRIAGEGVVTE